jgi:WD40 repeat protein
VPEIFISLLIMTCVVSLLLSLSMIDLQLQGTCTCGEETKTWAQLGSDIVGEFPGEVNGIIVSVTSDGKRFATYGMGTDGTAHVRVYEYDGTDWVPLGSDIIVQSPGEELGPNSIAFSDDGTTVATGSIGDESVEVYRYDGSDWERLGSPMNGPGSFSMFGYAVALSYDGETVAVSAPVEDQVQVFKYNSITLEWDQVGEDIHGANIGDTFGYSISLSSDGKTLAVGAIYHDGIDTIWGEVIEDSGLVRVYNYDEDLSDWLQYCQDIVGAMGDEFGSSVSLSPDGRTVAIGAVNNNNKAGLVTIWAPGDGEWYQLGALDIIGDTGGDTLGWSVSLSTGGNLVAVGAPAFLLGGVGYVRLFEYVEGDWQPLDLELVGEPGEALGFSVSVSDDGGTVVFSAPFHGDGAGVVRVYQLG